MTVTDYLCGHKIYHNKEKGEWLYVDDNSPISIKKCCKKCGKLSVDLNNVKNCDYCLQRLTECDFIKTACCGHGVEQGYIMLKDGRRFVLEQNLGDD